MSDYTESFGLYSVEPINAGAVHRFHSKLELRGRRSQWCVYVWRWAKATQQICITFVGRVAIGQLGAVKDTRKKISVMNMSLWCPTNVRPWLWAAICKTTLQLHSTYCWYDLWHSQGRPGIITVQTVVIKLKRMSLVIFNKKLIAVWFCRESLPPLKDLMQHFEEFKIWCLPGLLAQMV